ncbi:MAG TPA: ABC transporter substrate-binding protein [Roseiarcus sp.]|nr:ABC transporter substrate-binding protein [Roseiarcus sp.]
MATRRSFLQSGAAAAVFGSWARPARAANTPGVTDTEIKIGQTMPYSGPVSAYGVIGRTEAAYFKMINEQGGVNGRKITLISLDDGYSPPKTVELVRQLVEGQRVAFLFQTLGTPPNLAIRQYLNDNKVPQLFVSTGAAMFSDPQHFPWTMGFIPSYQTEAHIFAKHILATKPDAKIGVLYQNDGFGKDYLIGLRDGLGADHAGMVIKEVSYEVSEPTVDSQIVTLQGSGADVFLIAATPKAAAQAIRKTFDLGWTPVRYMSYVSGSIVAVMKPAGVEKSKGVITGLFGKDPNDPRWKDDPGMKEWREFCMKYMSATEYPDGNAVVAFTLAEAMVQVLKQVRRRPLAREHHEAGGQPQGPRTADAAAGDEDQHLTDQLQPDPPDATGDVQRRELGAVWRTPHRVNAGYGHPRCSAPFPEQHA